MCICSDCGLGPACSKTYPECVNYPGEIREVPVSDTLLHETLEEVLADLPVFPALK